MHSKNISIRGMHCRSCEIMIEEELKSVPGVTDATASHSNSSARVYFKGEAPDAHLIRKAVEKAGYALGKEERQPLFSRNLKDYYDLAIAGVILYIIYILLDSAGLQNFLNPSNISAEGLFPVFLVGLTAGLSTCMALVGGLVLGVSAKFSQNNPDRQPFEKFKPHLMFNAGRIISYAILGGIIGMAGSVFQISGPALGVMTLMVAGVMLILGLQLTNLFPRISNLSFTVPKGIAKAVGLEKQAEREYSHKNAFILGGLTFFLPCGFTQAMQLLAIASGNFISGASIMGMFALGTVPGLLGLGGIASFLKGKTALQFFKFSGAVVIALAFFNAQNGLNLMGLTPSLFLSQADFASASENTQLKDGVQVIKMTQHASGYSPNAFTLTKGIPVRWEINSTQPSCASSLIVPKFGIRKNLQPGENVIEFTPNESGRIPFSCSMGMYTGVFNVVEKGTDIKTSEKELLVQAPPAAAGSGGSCGGSGGCGCGGRNAGQEKVTGNTDTQGDLQVIKTTYSSDTDISPNEFTVKSGIPVRMEIDVRDNGIGCMSSIAVPKLADDPKFLEKGSTLVFEFTPISKGNYPITCAMGMPRGLIKVI